MPSKNEIAATMTRSEAARAGIIDANQAVEKITTNSKRMYGFTRKMIPTDFPTEPKLYIYSISQYGELVNLGPGFQLYEVFACPEDKQYGPPCVVLPFNFFEEAKVDVTEHTFQSGEQMADAIMMIGPGMAAALNKQNIGWFVSGHNPPEDREIERAKELFLAQCQKLIREADNYYARNQLNEINEMHRRAAKYCKQTKKAWVSIEYKMIDCPGCMEPVREGILFHAPPQGCGYIFDPDEYNKRYAQAKTLPAKAS